MPKPRLVQARPSLTRPQPPEHTLSPIVRGFWPAPEVEAWLRATFIDQDAILRNDEHAHLRFADFGVLWTNVPNSRAGRDIIGMCEIMPPRAMGKWPKARVEQQIGTWFGRIPDFIITLYAPYCLVCSDATFAAICEHELYHAGQEQGFEGPKFKADGSPKFCLRAHDIEEFIGVVKRYGAQATHTDAFVKAALEGPTVSDAQLDWACGACMKAAA